MKGKVRRLLILSALLLTASCAHQQQYAVKDGTTAEDRAQDDAYCQSQLVQPEPLPRRDGNWTKRSFSETRDIEARLRKDYIKCLTSMGYTIHSVTE
jgi:Spy/CpxP family protein refolding chaperone